MSTSTEARLRHIKRGAALTNPEIDTLRALVMADGGSLDVIAGLLCCHPNSVKYRLNCIRAKWGRMDATRGEIERTAVRQGYVLLDGLQGMDAFVDWLLARLPTGGLTPVSTGLRVWLRDEAERFKRERIVVAA